eukprot:s6141_g3.t1
MDLVVHAAAFGLGVRKTNICFPWEREPVNPVFAKRPRLVPAPVYVPEVKRIDETVSLQKAEVEGRVRWTRKTSLIPWPIAQDRALARALESWRLIIMDDLSGSLVGRQIERAIHAVEDTPTVEQTISDALAGKSLSTLRARSSSLMAFGRWKKSLDVRATILPMSEAEAYAYIRELRELNAPRTKPSRFVEAMAFAFHMLGADVDNAMYSPRVRGAVATPLVIPKKKTQIRLLPAACNIPGVTGNDWASPWLENRRLHGLLAEPGVPTMPSPLSSGGWSLLPLEAAQATAWFRELLRDLCPEVPMDTIGTHSLKATMLSIMAKASCSTDLRRLAGYHVDPNARMALEYSRDAQTPVLHALEAISMAIQHGLFCPDASRARRWPVRGCHTLELAMERLSKSSTESGWYALHNQAESTPPDEDEALLLDSEEVQPHSEGYTPSKPLDDELWEQDSISSLSDPGERPAFQGQDCSTSDEERDAEVAAPIVGEALARDLNRVIHVRVFKHVISGCCHVAKDGDTDPDDGDAIVLKCGKIASRNFEEVEMAGNFLPYKCSRCFANH